MSGTTHFARSAAAPKFQFPKLPGMETLVVFEEVLCDDLHTPAADSGRQGTLGLSVEYLLGSSVKQFGDPITTCAMFPGYSTPITELGLTLASRYVHQVSFVRQVKQDTRHSPHMIAARIPRTNPTTSMAYLPSLVVREADEALAFFILLAR